MRPILAALILIVPAAAQSRSQSITAPSVPAQATTEEWQFEQTTDPMTDKPSALAYVIGQGGTLGIKCDQAGPGSVYVALVADSYLGGRGGAADLRAVLVRADAEAPQSTEAIYKGRTITFEERQQVTALVVKMTIAKRIAFRVSTYDREIRDIVFTNLTGGSEAMVKVFRACDADGLNRMMGRTIIGPAAPQDH